MKQAMRTGMVLVLAITICFAGAETNMAKKKVVISKKKLNLGLGQTFVIKVKNTKAGVKWTSGNTKCARVSKKGKIKAVGIGTTTIRARTGKKIYSCKVTVCSGIKESEIPMKFNNAVFSKEFTGKIKQISFGDSTVRDRMAQKQISARFSELSLQETAEAKGLHVKNSSDSKELKTGVLTPIRFTLTDGTEYRVESTKGQLGVTVVQGNKQVTTYYNVVAFTTETENLFWEKAESDVEKYCEQ